MMHLVTFTSLREVIVKRRRQIEAGEEYDGEMLFAHGLADAAEDLMLAIRDRWPDDVEAHPDDGSFANVGYCKGDPR